MVGEVEQDLVSATVELLRERHHGLRTPIGPIGGAKYRDIDTFLFDDAGNAKGENQRSTLFGAQSDLWTGPGFADRRFRQ